MKKSAVFALLLSFVMIFSACGDATGPAASTNEDGERVLNLSILAPLTTIDPHESNNIQDIMVFYQVFEPLYKQNEATGEYMPRISDSYSISDDGTVYTFNIRDGVKFHNGDTLKASDVEFSYKRAMDSPKVRSYMAGIVDVEATNDSTVVVTLDQPNAALMTNLSYIFIISEREAAEQGDLFGTQLTLAGTGPYYLTHLVHDVEWTVKACPNYYLGEASIKEIYYVPITDASAGLITFESGSLDWYIAPIADWDGLVANSKHNTELVAANHISYVVLNHLNAPLDNDNLRRAIAYAIDKEAMNMACFNGLAVNADFMVRGTNTGAPTNGIVYNYDPDKARELLAEAGIAEGTNIGTINCSAGGYFEKMAQVLQDNLAAVGLVTDIQRLDSATNLEMARRYQFDLLTTGFAANGDFDSWKMYTHTDFVGTFYNKYDEGDKFDWEYMNSLWEAGVATADVKERVEIYTELNDWIADTATQIPIFHRVLPYVWTTDLNVPVNYPNYPLIYEWSWK